MGARMAYTGVMTELVRPEVEDAIRAVVTERLGEDALSKISVTPDEDHDGDPILRVQVELKRENDRPVAGGLLDLLSAMRGRLETLNEYRFPHPRLLTPSDLDEFDELAGPAA